MSANYTHSEDVFQPTSRYTSSSDQSGFLSSKSSSGRTDAKSESRESMSFSQLQNGRNMPPPSTQYPIESERYSSVLESRSMSQSIAGSEGRSLSRVSAREEYSDLRRVYVGGQQGNSKPGGDHSLRRSSSVSIHAPQQSRRPASVYSGRAAGQNRQTRRQSNSSYVSEGQQSSTHIQGPPVQPTQFNQEEVSRARISDFKAQWEASQRTSDWARRQNIPPAQPSPPRPLSHATHERTNQQSRQQSPLADRHPHNSDQQNRVPSATHFNGRPSNTQFIPASRDDLLDFIQQVRHEFASMRDRREEPQAAHGSGGDAPSPQHTEFHRSTPFPVLKRTRTGNPHRRTAVELQVARMVRGHLETLIEKNSQILPTVLDEERDAYAEESVRPNNREATSEGNFRFDVLGTPNSPWNKSAARVFSELTIRQLCLPNTVEMFNAIKHAFTAHMETIMRRYKRSGLSKSEKAHLKSMLRRYSRKYQLFRQRRFLAYMFKPLQKHIDMVEYLGVDGMSSDESEMEDVGGEHHVQYLIRSPRWRARCVSVWLRMFDSLHNILRRSGESFSHRGSFPRRRKPTQQQSLSTKFVAGLPINVYDEHWIERDPVRKYDLRPLTQHYDFSHDEDIMELALQYAHGGFQRS